MTTRRAIVRARVSSERVLEQAAQSIGLAAAARVRVGQLTVVTPAGERFAFGDATSALQAEIRVHSARAMAQILLKGETGAGEAFMDSGWTSPDLPALLELAALNREALALSRGWWQIPGQLQRMLVHRTRRNTRVGARRNIQAHYDLGNDFYRLFLDETLTYSCAVFASPGQSLADAQRNKYRLIAEGACLARGSHVLEIGSGWGGFALYAAGDLGCRVTTITISREQLELARERVAAAGLTDHIDVQLRDYREIAGAYDAVVSIEMLEAVGAEYYEAFFRACDAALKPGGRLSLQTITFRHDAYLRQRSGANWIQQYIFPGGLVPSLAAIEYATGGTRLLLRSVRDIGEHYVRTLRTWRETFQANVETVKALGFDDRFVRIWEYYLAISEAGFRTGLAQDLQIVFQKRRGMALQGPGQ
jgi:cyclopropane-fatty-acyl-phospholipid synthase